MIIEKYPMAVFYILRHGMLPISAVYSNTHQQQQAAQLVELGLLERRGRFVIMTDKGKAIYAMLQKVEELEGCTDYMDMADHIAMMNAKRKAGIRRRYAERKAADE